MKTSIICVFELTLGTSRVFDLRFRQHKDGFRPTRFTIGVPCPTVLSIDGLYVGDGGIFDVNLLRDVTDGFVLGQPWHEDLLACPTLPSSKIVRLIGRYTGNLGFAHVCLGNVGDHVEFIGRLEGSVA
jgi:hypothetical protein